MIIAFVVFAIIVTVCILLAVFYVYSSEVKSSNIPGPPDTGEADGHFMDIALAHGLFRYLLYLHNKYGSMCRFRWGKTVVVSVGSVNLIKEIDDRTALFLDSVEPLINKTTTPEPRSSADRARKIVFDKSLGDANVMPFIPEFLKHSEQLIKVDLASISEKEEFISHKMLFTFAAKATASVLFKESNLDMELLDNLAKGSKMYISMLIDKLCAVPSLKVDAGKQMNESVKKVLQNGDYTDTIQNIFDYYKKNKEDAVNDVIKYYVAITHISSLWLTWVFYQYALHPQTQTKVCEEIKTVLGDKPLNEQAIPKLKYTLGFLEEVVRFGRITSFTTSVQEYDGVIGDYFVPQNTLLIHNYATALWDEDEYDSPEKFDMDRFSEGPKLDLSFLKYPEYRFSFLLVLSVVSLLSGKYVVKIDKVGHPHYGLWFLDAVQEESSLRLRSKRKKEESKENKK